MRLAPAPYLHVQLHSFLQQQYKGVRQACSRCAARFSYGAEALAITLRLQNYIARRHAWEVEPNSIVWLNGLVPALNLFCRMVGEVGDGATNPESSLQARTKLSVRAMEYTSNRWIVLPAMPHPVRCVCAPATLAAASTTRGTCANTSLPTICTLPLAGYTTYMSFIETRDAPRHRSLSIETLKVGCVCGTARCTNKR